MKMSDFMFGLFLGLALMFIPFAFCAAYIERGYIAIGGESLTFILPALVILARIEKVKRRKLK